MASNLEYQILSNFLPSTMSSPVTADTDFENFSATDSASSPASTFDKHQIIQAIWDNKSLATGLASGETDRLHHTNKFNYPIGTIVLCINKDTRSIFGVATITGECVERCLLDPTVYTGVDYAKYNRFECTIRFRKFTTPIECETVSAMCGTAKRAWFYHLCMRTCYLAGKKADVDVKTRFLQLVYTWI